jgi:hypothetical protein
MLDKWRVFVYGFFMPAWDTFRGDPNPKTDETEFELMDFSQPVPVEVGGKWRPVRVTFRPDDSIPRTLTDCLCLNCEFGPSVTLDRCTTCIVRPNVDMGGGERANLVTGRWVPATGRSEDFADPHVNVIQEVG